MSVTIRGISSGNGAEVDSNNKLKINLPESKANAGYNAAASCVDEGNVTGSRVVRELEATEDYRLRVGQDSLLFQEYFPGTAINSSVWAAPIATSTVVVAGGVITLNNGGSLTAAQGAMIRSHRTFPLLATYPLFVEMLVQVPNLSFNNAICEWGAGIIGVAPGTAAVDGAFFRLSTGGLSCVITNNNQELSETFPDPALIASKIGALTQTLHYLISINDDSISFWINDIRVAHGVRNTTGGSITQSQQIGLFARQINSGTNTLIAQKLVIAMFAVSLGDGNMDKPWGHRKAGAGDMSCQSYTGVAVARTAAWNTWAALPAQTTTIAATAMGTGATTGLGGIQRLGNGASTLALAVDTPSLLFSYLVPALVTAVPIVPAKGLYVTKVKISALSRGAAGPAGLCAFNYNLSVGGLAVNPATAENAATPAKLGRPIILGAHSLVASAPIGAMFSPDVEIDLTSAPAYYAPGEYVQIMANPNVAYTIGANQELVFFCTIVGYWE